MLTFQEYLNEKAACSVFTPKQLEDLEKFADRLLNKFGIDIEFTKHFAERLGHERNDPCISLAELQQFFKKVAKAKGKKIKGHGEGQAVLVDIQKDLNLPVAIEMTDDGDFEVTLKTIMRKKNFTSSTEKIPY